MTRLRSLLILLLAVALLPWGTFVARTTVPAPPRAEAVAQTQGVVPAPKRCRIGVLPGAPCGQEHLLAPGLGDAQEATQEAPRENATLTFAKGRHPTPPREPPRQV